jgi:ribosome-associated protein
MIRINPDISIQEDELVIEFIRSSGPGGQNVNKVSTAAQLRFDVAKSPSLPEHVKRRLSQLAGSKLTRQGIIVIDAHRHRTQARNREDAIERLAELIRQAAHVPKRRRSSKPTAASKRRRLDTKRRRSETKKSRSQFEDAGS